MAIFAKKPHRLPQGPFVFEVAKTVASTEYAYVALDGMARPGATNTGYRVQVMGGDVEVSFTLADRNLVNKQEFAASAGVNWEVAGTATAAASLQLDSLPTALRLKFTAPGSAAISSL